MTDLRILDEDDLIGLMRRDEADATIASFETRIGTLETLLENNSSSTTIAQIQTDIDNLDINKADVIHTHAWSAITGKPTIPADNSATVTSLSNTVSSHATSMTKFQSTRTTVAALSDVPNMPTQGGSLTVLGLTVVSFQDFQNLWNYCQQIGNRVQSMIAAHRPA